jgi:hypothetical protein
MQWNRKCIIAVDVEMDSLRKHTDIFEMRRCGIARRAQIDKISA